MKPDDMKSFFTRSLPCYHVLTTPGLRKSAVIMLFLVECYYLGLSSVNLAIPTYFYARGGGGWGYLGQVLLGMCRWPLRTNTSSRIEELFPDFPISPKNQS